MECRGQIEQAFKHMELTQQKKSRERIWRKEKTRKLEIRTRKKYFATVEARVAMSSNLPLFSALGSQQNVSSVALGSQHSGS